MKQLPQKHPFLGDLQGKSWKAQCIPLNLKSKPLVEYLELGSQTNFRIGCQNNHIEGISLNGTKAESPKVLNGCLYYDRKCKQSSCTYNNTQISTDLYNLKHFPRFGVELHLAYSRLKLILFIQLEQDN